MKCPVCKDPSLVMSERQGVEIDYCPTCRGVWLDRGELDKLIEKAATAMPAQAQAPQLAHHAPAYDNRPVYHKKQKSWLNEIFD